MTGSRIVAAFAVVCDLLLAGAAYGAASTLGAPFWASQALIGGLGFVITAVGAGLTVAGLPRNGTVAAVGGVVLAGAYLRYETMFALLVPAGLGAAGVLGFYLNELAVATRAQGRLLVPITRGRTMAATALGVTLIVATLGGALVHFGLWHGAAARDRDYESRRSSPTGDY